jgi:hypothetical protein
VLRPGGLTGIPGPAALCERRKFFFIFSAAIGNLTVRPAFPSRKKSVNGLSCPKMGAAMSPILPISLLIAVFCFIGAIDGILFQQLLFVGAAVAVTVLVCSVEAWSAREPPAPREDDDL